MCEYLRVPPEFATARSTPHTALHGHSSDLAAASHMPNCPCRTQGASKAKEFTRTLARGQREYLVAMRSEGQFVGEMASFATAALRCATVRAKGPVHVRLVPGVLLSDCVERIPEVCSLPCFTHKAYMSAALCCATCACHGVCARAAGAWRAAVRLRGAHP